MNEMITYCLNAFLPPFLLTPAMSRLPRRLLWIRRLVLLWPGALLVLAGVALAADPGFFIGWNAFVAGWFAILAGLALTGFGLGMWIGNCVRKRSV